MLLHLTSTANPRYRRDRTSFFHDGAMRKLTDALWEGIGAGAPQFDASMNTGIHDGVTLHCSQGTPP